MAYERDSMNRLRTILRRHRALAALALALVLSVKLLIPSGFMLDANARVLTVTICTGVVGVHGTTQLVIPMSGKRSGHDADKGDPCPYSALSMASLSGADGPLLAAALAFILALGFAPAAVIARERAPHLRPPPRGPPAFA